MQGEVQGNSKNKAAKKFVEILLWVIAILIAAGLFVFQGNTLWGIAALFFVAALVARIFKSKSETFK